MKSRRILLGNQYYQVPDKFHNRFPIDTTHETWLDDIYRVTLALKAGAFIDVGANVGQTLLKILEIDQRRAYVGFEPQISCCHCIEQFIIANKLERYWIIPVGLSNSTGLKKLLLRHSLSDTTASLIEDFRPKSFYKHALFVPTIPGDDVIPMIGAGPVAVLKVDVEGGEMEVVEGCQTTIAKN